MALAAATISGVSRAFSASNVARALARSACNVFSCSAAFFSASVGSGAGAGFAGSGGGGAGDAMGSAGGGAGGGGVDPEQATTNTKERGAKTACFMCKRDTVSDGSEQALEAFA